MFNGRNGWDTSDDNGLLANALKGALAGAVGVWAMDKVTWWMWDRQPPETLRQEEEARPEGMDPAHIVANRAAEAAGTELMPRQPHPAGIGVHYALGVGPAVIYAAARSRGAWVRPGFGVLLGLGLFLMQDELLNPILGTSGTPGEYPWQAHVRGLVGHVTYGAVTDAALALLDEAL